MPDNNQPTVAKAKISIVDKNGNAQSGAGKSLTCMYNPESMQYNRAPTFEKKEIPNQTNAQDHRAGGGKATLSVKLFFDTTRSMQIDGRTIEAGSDVRKHIRFLLTLLQEDPQTPGQQPFCNFEWGGKLYIYKGFCTSVDVTYSLFKPDGTPIRAEASVRFEEQAAAEALDRMPQNPTSRSEARKTWIVHEGDRLDWIAYKEYGNAAYWRHIAETNHIADPFNLQTGQILKLVKLPW